MKNSLFDMAVIGGGINGCGIARDGAGRGLSVFLSEQGDLAQGTSSASTKLIHGGLRYLEYCDFRLVREALREREILLRAAPHIVRPLRFILPHHEGLRPAWLIRLGLLLYDHLGGRRLLPASSSIDLRQDDAGRVLKQEYVQAFEYSDCRVMDSRLVVLNAMDAAARGAEIRTRTRLLSATRDGGLWTLTLEDLARDRQYSIQARTLVNAAGPWLAGLQARITHGESRERIRLVKGSHIIVPKLFNHDRAYIFQNRDRRVIFAIPYEEDFTLIGTTELDFHGDPGEAAISAAEINYLCRAASEYFTRQLTPDEVVSSFSGVRMLFDDGRREARAATRDYVLKLDAGRQETPLLSICGGKLTTYRSLAEAALERLAPFLPQMTGPWTAGAHLPGGDFPLDGHAREIRGLLAACPVLGEGLASRLVGTYGTRARAMTGHIHDRQALGPCFGAGLYGFEVDYLIAREWARTAADILWRRTRLGLHLGEAEAARLEEYVSAKVSAGSPDRRRPGLASPAAADCRLP